MGGWRRNETASQETSLNKNVFGRYETQVEVRKIASQRDRTLSELVDQGRPFGCFQLILYIIDLEPKEGRKSKKSRIFNFFLFFLSHRGNCSGKF